jgi:hypothetical protein
MIRTLDPKNFLPFAIEPFVEHLNKFAEGHYSLHPYLDHKVSLWYVGTSVARMRNVGSVELQKPDRSLNLVLKREIPLKEEGLVIPKCRIILTYDAGAIQRIDLENRVLGSARPHKDSEYLRKVLPTELFEHAAYMLHKEKTTV